jgi:hypothetical protein
MDHAQGRAFHHHLARAIMHLNYLAGLLPFFEPSIEWDDPTTDHQFRTGRPNPASRSLHTFAPLPASSNPPTMVSHGGIPSHMILNPEPNLRPLTRFSREEEGHNPIIEAGARAPVPSGGHASTPPLDNSTLPTPTPGHPRVTTRITTPVPVRSKQRSTSRHPSLPIISEIPHTGFNSDDSDEDAASKAPSAHESSVMDTGPTATTTMSSTSHTTPPGTSTPLVLIHPTPPYASFNLRILLEIPVIHRTDRGQIWMIKSSSISKMTRSPVLHGKQLGRDYVVTLRSARCDGRSSSKCLTSKIASSLLTNQRQKIESR